MEKLSENLNGSTTKPGDKLDKILFLYLMKTEEILKLLLPAYLIEYFDVVKFEEIDGLLHLYFEEKKHYAKRILFTPTPIQRLS